MLTLIIAALVLSALYTGGMWLYLGVQSFRFREGYEVRPDLADQIERYTFHLGLCFILAVGFLGLLLG